MVYKYRKLMQNLNLLHEILHENHIELLTGYFPLLLDRLLMVHGLTDQMTKNI